MAVYDLVEQRKPILRLVIGGALFILLGVLIWILVASNHSNNQTGTGSGGNTSPQASSGSSSQGTPPPSTNPPSGTSGQSVSGPSSPVAAGSSSAAAGQTPAPNASAPSAGASDSRLANTGPGQVIWLFVGVTAIATLLHYRHGLLKSRKA